MKKKLLIFTGAFVSLVVLYSSCRVPILKTLYGIHEPRIENEQSILAAAGKYQLNKNSIVCLAPSSFKAFNKMCPGISEALVFDREGNYIEYKATDSSCNAGLFSFIPSLYKNGHYKMSGKTNLNAEMKRFRNLRGESLNEDFLNKQADFYILISWATWAGRLSKDHVKVWQDLATANKKARIQVVAVDMDLQQWWPPIARDSISAAHSKI